MATNTNNECPICMDCISGNVNCVVTECGHKFHTNCLMTNVAHNGFGCPYCRAVMAEEPEDEEEDTISYITVDTEDNDDDDDESTVAADGQNGEEYNAASTLRSIRRLFIEEEVEEEEEAAQEPPSIEYVVQMLQQKGFTYERLVKTFLAEFDQYDDIEQECLEEADQVFDSIHRIIHQDRSEEGVSELQNFIANSILRSSYA